MRTEIITVTTPDGVYEILRFPDGIVHAGTTFWWTVQRAHYGSETEGFFTSLEGAFEFLARRILTTCF